jgi:hypothetical protein
VTRLANEGNGKWSRASISIGGDALRPDQISSTLGLKPKRSGVKGERSSSRHSVARRTSFWLLTCPLSYSLPLAEHLTWLLDQLEPKLNLIKSIAEEWNATLFCGFSAENGGESPLIQAFWDVSQIWKYPLCLISIHRVRLQKCLLSFVINGS